MSRARRRSSTVVSIPLARFHASLRSLFRVVGNPALISLSLPRRPRSSISSIVRISGGGGVASEGVMSDSLPMIPGSFECGQDKKQTVDRVMTDNAWAYRRSQSFAEALSEIGAAHKLTRPYRPQTNGKVERFHQTLLAGWAYKQPYENQPATTPSPPQVPPHLQSPPTPQLTRRPTTHQPTCNSPLWEGHLGHVVCLEQSLSTSSV